MAEKKNRRDDFSQKDNSNAVRVEIRLMFLQIGSINTQSEQFDAHVAIEARWLATDSILSTLDDHAHQNLSQGHIEHLPDDFHEQKQNWHPKLFLLNSSLNKEDTQIRYSLRKDDSDDDNPSAPIYVREHRFVKGSFCTTFHFHQYPNDVQTLTLSIGSSLSANKVQLVQHPTIASGINKEIFEAQQEWHLYEHVETTSRTVRGYFSSTDEDGDLDKPGYEKERSVLTFSCHAARRSGYFFWNGFCIVFLLTSVAFSSFAITADETQQRLSITCTLLLSQIAFRWTISVSQLLPPVSYLTTMDKYSVISIFALIILGTWHAIIGSLIFSFNNSQPITTETYWLWLDRYVFFALGFVYIVMHVVFIVCHFRGPYRHRQKMMRKDMKYREQNFDSKKKTHDQSNHV